MQTQIIAETTTPADHSRTKHLSDLSIADARARLRRALAAEGFSLIADIDLADLLNRRLDVAVEPYYIIEACHPLLAKQALAVASDGALLTPTKICLWKEGSGATAATVSPIRLAEALGRPHLLDVAASLDKRLDRVFERLANGAVPGEEPFEPGPAVLDLAEAERRVLRDATRRHIEELIQEAASTDSRPLQHELAQTIDRLENVARKLDVATSARS